MDKIIQTHNLTKAYKDILAVNEVNLSIKQGEIYGFLGLNGAGKTTTIRMLLGMITPTSGECYIEGTKVTTNNLSLWNNVGYMVETPNAYPELTVKENLVIFQKLRNLPNKQSVEIIMERLNIKQYENTKTKNLSLGNKQRLGIAKALIHKPKILILDEPTNGLDPAGIIEVRNLLKYLSEGLGVTILISSHNLDEVSKVATKIGIIHNGYLIKEINGKNLDKQLKKTLYLDCQNKESMIKILKQSGYSFLYKEIGPIEVTSIKAIEHPELLAVKLVNENCPPRLLHVEKENLETYFLRMLAEEGVDSK